MQITFKANIFIIMQEDKEIILDDPPLRSRIEIRKFSDYSFLRKI